MPRSCPPRAFGQPSCRSSRSACRSSRSQRHRRCRPARKAKIDAGLGLGLTYHPCKEGPGRTGVHPGYGRAVRAGRFFCGGFPQCRFSIHSLSLPGGQDGLNRRSTTLSLMGLHGPQAHGDYARCDPQACSSNLPALAGNCRTKPHDLLQTPMEASGEKDVRPRGGARTRRRS